MPVISAAGLSFQMRILHSLWESTGHMDKEKRRDKIGLWGAQVAARGGFTKI